MFRTANIYIDIDVDIDGRVATTVVGLGFRALDCTFIMVRVMVRGCNSPYSACTLCIEAVTDKIEDVIAQIEDLVAHITPAHHT